MIDQEKVGKFIADLRKEKGLTQDDLAEKMFVGEKQSVNGKEVYVFQVKLFFYL